MKIFKNWAKRAKEKQKQDELVTIKESILLLLLRERTTEETVNIYLEVEEDLFSKLETRLKNIKEEEIILEKLLHSK